uniref:Protein kinase domain-containing protein n=1 Tax=Loa loa TaxID=7209 RepID=A0A1I7VZN5_LOALO
MTSPADSEGWRTNNWKIGNSRLSLNEAFFMDGPPGVPSTVFPMPTVIPLPPLTLKQFKKWQKRQKKMLKKMGSIPANLMPPRAPVTPMLQYSRAFSVDNLSRQMDVPVGQKCVWKKCRKVIKNQTYGNTAPDLPSGPLKSSFSSSCSNGFAVSDLRMTHSAPSTNTSDRSRLTSTTDHSSSLHYQTPSPIQLKNSSNQHLQRIRAFRNDVGPSGTPRRLQQWTLVAKGGPSSTEPHETADDINEETSSEVKKCGIGHKSPDINYASRKTAAISECSYPKAATSHDCDERNYRYRNGIGGSANRSNQYSDYNTNNGGHIIPGCNIPVKITPEPEETPKKNDQLFSKNVTNSTDDDKVFSTVETASNPFQRCNSTSGTTKNHATHQTQLGYSPLKKSADYGSTISSLTQSSNMKTEVSDIDFSWVNDVENRLDREITFVKEDSRPQLQREQQLPVQYFGMDLNQSRAGKDGAAIIVSPAHPTTTKSFEVFGECESRKELSQIHSDVRSKAAMFDTEAFRNERKVDEQQAAYRYRSRSTPRDNVYIPQPDYRGYDPISVDISQNSTRYDSIPSSNTPVAYGSKYDRRPQHNNESSNMKLDGSVTESRAKCGNSYYCNSKKMTNRQQQQQPYSGNDNEMLQRNRTYDATECYIQNAAQRSAEEPWRISVAY